MQAVDRVVRVLETLAEGSASLSITEIAGHLKLPPSSLHRLLAALQRYGYVHQDKSSRRYGLGAAVLGLHDRYVAQTKVAAAAVPWMRGLSARTRETAFLTVLEGDDAVCATTVDSVQGLRFFMRAGQRMPYYGAASAQAILAFQRPEVVRRVVAQEVFTPLTPQTIRNPEELLARLSQVAAAGFAVCDGELEVGVVALAAPVRGRDGAVSASLAVIAPSERLRGERQADALQELLAAAEGLSSDICGGRAHDIPVAGAASC